jgi:spermidine synthase
MNQLQTDTALMVKTSGDAVSVLWEADDMIHTQSSYDPGRPSWLRDTYARLVAGGMLMAHDGFPLRGSALHLGVGAGVLARFTCEALHMKTHGIDLSPTMLALAKLLFGVREDVQLTQADGMKWVAQPACAGAYDVIVSDMYLPGTLLSDAVTREFFENCRTALNPAGGTLVCNFSSINLAPDPAIAELAGVFGAQQVFLLVCRPLHRFSNVIAVASTTPLLDPQRLHQRLYDIARLYADNGLTAAELQGALLPSLALPAYPHELA